MKTLCKIKQTVWRARKSHWPTDWLTQFSRKIKIKKKGHASLFLVYLLNWKLRQELPLSLTEMCSSIMQSLIQAPLSSPTTPVSFLESGRYTPVTSVFGTRDTTVGNVERKAQTAPRRKISYESRLVTLQKKAASPRATGSLGTRRSAYIPPVVPPKMEDWMPDQQVSLCVICQERFSMVINMSRLSLEMF